MLQYYSEHMFEDSVGEKGISARTEKEFAKKIESAAAKVAASIRAGEYGFIDLVSSDKYIHEVYEVYREFNWASTLVVVGIGGSDLGGRAIDNALPSQHSDMDVLFHGDSTDPNDLDVLLRRIDLERTVFNIISKSGATTETAAQFMYLKQMYEQRSVDWTKHFVFTTSGEDGVLHGESQVHGIPILEIPEDVGGRFSVLSPVGLFPALAMGVDIRQMVKAAAESVSAFLGDPLDSVGYEIAEQQYLLYEQDVEAVVFMPYSTRMNEFGRWFRQLWAESLGKNDEGILPIQAYGPADQHSQLQFYTQGNFLASVLFLRVANHGSSHMIEMNGVPGLEYLEGKDFGEMLNIEQEATELSLLKAGRPSATLELDQINATSLGELFINFQIAVVILAELLEVNAFNQPGVEESKNFMYALLGRDGYQDKLDEINLLRDE